MDQYESSQQDGTLPTSTKLVEAKADIGLVYSF